MVTSSEGDSEDEEMLFLLLLRCRRRRLCAANRHIRMKRWILRREAKGAYANLVPELNVEDPEKIKQYHRLDRNSFQEILAMESL